MWIYICVAVHNLRELHVCFVFIPSRFVLMRTVHIRCVLVLSRFYVLASQIFCVYTSFPFTSVYGIYNQASSKISVSFSTFDCLHRSFIFTLTVSALQNCCFLQNLSLFPLPIIHFMRSIPPLQLTCYVIFVCSLTMDKFRIYFIWFQFPFKPGLFFFRRFFPW